MVLVVLVLLTTSISLSATISSESDNEEWTTITETIDEDGNTIRTYTGYSDYEVIVPDDDTTTYSVALELQRADSESNNIVSDALVNETYEVTYTAQDGSETTEEIEFVVDTEFTEYGRLTYSFENIAAGTTILINKVMVTKSEYVVTVNEVVKTEEVVETEEAVETVEIVETEEVIETEEIVETEETLEIEEVVEVVEIEETETLVGQAYGQVTIEANVSSADQDNVMSITVEENPIELIVGELVSQLCTVNIEETTEESTEETTEESTEETTEESTEETTEESTEETTEESTEETEIAVPVGNYQLAVPTDENRTYNVTISLLQYYGEENALEDYADRTSVKYHVTISNEGEEAVTTEYTFVRTIGEDGEVVLSLALSGVKSGSVIFVKDIVLESLTYDESGAVEAGSYDTVKVESSIEDENDADAEIDIVTVDGVEVEVVESTEENIVGMVTTTSTSTNSSMSNEDSDSATEVQEGVTLFQMGVDNSVEDTSVTGTTRETTDTFLSVNGLSSYNSYTLLYLLNNYNVVSFEDIEAEHIVGPIIAQEEARRTSTDVGIKDGAYNLLKALYFGDYSNGISSYIGELSTTDSDGDGYGDGDVANAQVNYGFDDGFGESWFEAPYLYTTLNTYNTFIDVIDEKDYISVNDSSYFLSGNDGGTQLTYQSDTFIDFDKLWSVIEDTSDQILEDGSIEGKVDTVYTYDDSEYSTEGLYGGDFTGVTVEKNGVTITDTVTYTYANPWNDYKEEEVEEARVVYEWGVGLKLNIYAGESWTIVNADELGAINIIYPDGYDYFTNPYLESTTINFSCSTINTITINMDADGDGDKEDVVHSQIPNVYVNGSLVRAETDENGEYGEGGKKIIWNFPNLVTGYDKDGEVYNRVKFAATSTNFLGHIIAPNAELWNYSATATSWDGGNLNGTAIVKSFYSGAMEMHMWAYDGEDEATPYASYTVTASKTVDGEKPEGDIFEFELTYVPQDPDDEDSIKDGIMNSVSDFPMTALSKTGANSGSISFGKLEFDKVGDYEFILKESITNSATGFTYDLTQYKLTISVREVDGVLEAYMDSIIKIVDSEGNDIGPTTSVDEMTFNNLTNPEEDTTELSLTLTKRNQYEETLSDVEFLVQSVTVDDGVPTVESSGYSEYYTSTSAGKIYITDLEENTTYMVTETKTPYEHEEFTGYWLIEVNEDLSYTIQEYNAENVEVSTVTDLTIYNEKIVFALPETGELGPEVIYLGSAILILLAILIRSHFHTKIKRRNR